MTGPEKKGADALLAALEKEERRPDEVPEHIKMLVRMNPALKQEGLDTAQSASQLRDAVSKARAVAAGTPMPTEPKPATGAAAPTGLSLLETIQAAKKAHQKEQAELAEQAKELNAELQKVQARVQKLNDERKAAAARRCDEVISRLLSIDPDMTSPKTKLVLESEKSFLNEVGFSPAKVLEREKQKKKR